MSNELNISSQNKQKIIVANWKMNGSKTLLKEFSTFSQTKQNDIVLCPPFTLLSSAKALLPDFIKVGAQNCSEEGNGAFTGEISALMLRDSHVSHVIIGHSERRTLYGETNSVILKKVESVIKSELTPIVCIGETLSEKKAKKTLQVLEKQIDACITKVDAQSRLIVAYEPIWAIGTGLTPNYDEIRETHMHIKKKMSLYFSTNIPVLYGGSANSENCNKIISIENVDGLLVGGASLKKHDFEIICNC
ncbi:triose-phosphate isomerase [Paracoccaceae bacterium]|nr:triose-phosphate isomerase [Paracoccaceae bacterium]